MKTSNKLLIIAYSIIAIGVIIVLLKVRQLSNIEPIKLSGIIVEKNYDFESFDKLHVRGNVEVKLRQGSSNSMILTADSSLLEKFDVFNEDNELVIKHMVHGKHKNRVFVDLIVEDLDYLRGSAGSILRSDSEFISNDLEIEMNSGANMNLHINVHNLTMNINAGSMADFSGGAENCFLIASSGSNFNSINFITKKANIEAKSGANVEIKVVDELDAKCSSGGSVRYAGEPQLGDIILNSGGNLSKYN